MLDQNNRPKPWQILTSETRVKDRWIHLRSDKCQTPNGPIVDPYHVLEYGNWVNIMPFCAETMELIMVDEYRHGMGMPVLGLVSGGIDTRDGTDPETAAKVGAARELREETGYAASKPTQVLKSMPNPALQNNWVFSFIAFDAQKVSGPSFDQGHGEMCITVKRKFVEVVEAIANGQLHMQAMHIAALWSAAQYILKSDQLPQSALSLRAEIKDYLFG